MYDVYSSFDADKHAQTFINYLEVVIHHDGLVEYAVPSHQEKMISIACKRFGVSREELLDSLRNEFDFLRALCDASACISVWTDFCVTGSSVTNKQALRLKDLKLKGLYHGKLVKSGI